MSRLALLGLLVACDQPRSPDELVRWAEDPTRGLEQRGALGPLSVRARYEPATVRLARELLAEVTPRAEAVTRLAALEESEVIRLILWSEPGAPGRGALPEEARAFAETPCPSLRLEGAERPSPCRFALPVSGLAASGELTFLVAFDPVGALERGRVLVIAPSGSLGGPLMLSFPGAPLAALPDLEMDP